MIGLAMFIQLIGAYSANGYNGRNWLATDLFVAHRKFCQVKARTSIVLKREIREP